MFYIVKISIFETKIMEPNGIESKMSSEIERRFRLNEVITTVKNRIRWEQSEKFLPRSFEEKLESKAKVDAYVDVLGIITKEMIMELPYDYDING